MGELRLVRASAPMLEDALAEEIRIRKTDEPLTPVGVLIGGTLLRPYLGRRLAELCGGIANVHLITPSDLAVALGEPALLARGARPMPPLGDRVVAREAAGGHEGYFAPVKDASGFGDALHRLFRELRAAGHDGLSFATAVSGRCDAPGKDVALAELFNRFLERRSGFYSPDDCLLDADVGKPPWTALALYGIWDPPTALRSCLERLAEVIPVTIYVPSGNGDAESVTVALRQWAVGVGAEDRVPTTSEDESGSGLGQLRRRLFSADASPAPLDESVRLISAPDPPREVREVARECLAWAREGIPFRDTAIVFRHADQYRSLIESIFSEAGIPLYLHEGTPMSERPLGRRAIALLDLIDGGFERRAVIDFLADTRLPKATCDAYGGAPVQRWDRLTRQAGIVRGPHQWQERLVGWRNEILGGGEEAWRADEATRIDHLRAFARDLAAALRQHPARAPWSEHLSAFRRLLDRYVDGAEPLVEALVGLSRFDSLSPEVSFDRFRELVRGAIEGLRSDDVLGGRPGAFGRRGVNVIDANSFRHLRFRAVAVVGLSERSFPSPPRQDPLLLDHERERLNAVSAAQLPLRALGADPEPLQFALVVGGARERFVATFPRKSAGDARPQLPSVFFRAAAEAMTGRRVPAEDVDLLPRELYRRALGSQVGAASLDTALGPAERDRTLLEREPELGRASLVGTEPRLERAFRARAAMFSADLTPFDSALSEEVARGFLIRIRDPERAESPSSLEQYATCPQRYFLNSVLRARLPDEPELTVRISALHKGALVHRVLERFLAEQPDDEELLHGAGEPERLRRVASEEFAAAEARGETGYALTWGYDSRELLEDLERWLEQERADPAFRECPEGDFEIDFGMRDGEEPLELVAGEERVHVRGRIDRLQWDEARTRFRVIDYKTGSVRDDHENGELRGGRALQLPLYLLAGARRLAIDARRGQAEYHFATRKGKFERRTFSGTELTSRREEFDALLAGIAEGMRTGAFFMSPANGEKDCRWCDYDRLCPAARERTITRKANDPRAQALAVLREIR